MPRDDFFVEKHGDVSVSVFVGLPGLRCWTKGHKAEFWIHYCGGKRGWTLGVMAFHCGAAAGKLLFAGLMIVRLGIVPSGEGFGEEIWGGEACR